MIVDPDFLEHWKTRMLVDMLGDESAPLFVIRLWGHCQNRREWVFDGMPIHATKAICRYQGEAQDLEDALIACGFLEREGKEITVVGWDEHNASLIANWKNGARGGRPKKNPKETDDKPMGLPSDNPSVSDKIGLDRIGSDDTDIPPKSPKGEAVPFQEIVELYHKHLPMLPKVANISDTRKRALKARWSESVNVPKGDEVVAMKCNTLDFWERYFRRAAGQPFLVGDTSEWAADFDFLIKKNSFIKVIENKYARDS